MNVSITRRPVSDTLDVEGIILKYVGKEGLNFRQNYYNIKNYNELKVFLDREAKLVASFDLTNDKNPEDLKLYVLDKVVIFLHSEKYIYYKKGSTSETVYLKIRLYSDNPSRLERVKSIIEPLIDFKSLDETNGKVSVILKLNDNIELSSLDNPPSELPFENYNPDFKATHSKIVDILNKGEKGIILLQGDPGTGKSTYLKHLGKFVTGKELIFIPPVYIHLLSDPGFLGFLTEHSNSVLIIEDAESILQKRAANEHSAVSNLLNLTDGLISDLLKIQVICTLNAHSSTIDPAIRRPGRMLLEYEFKKLDVEKSNDLLKKYHPEDQFKTNIPLTLAEIYNFSSKVDTKQTTIGFRNG